MINNKTEYRAKRELLELEQARLAKHENLLRDLVGLAGEDLAEAMAPMRQWHDELVYDLDLYDRIERGDVGEIEVPRFYMIGEALVALRRARGLTQRELADRLGVHASQVSRDERTSYRSASLERIGRVLHALDVETHCVLTLVEE